MLLTAAVRTGLGLAGLLPSPAEGAWIVASRTTRRFRVLPRARQDPVHRHYASPMFHVKRSTASPKSRARQPPLLPRARPPRSRCGPCRSGALLWRRRDCSSVSELASDTRAPARRPQGLPDSAHRWWILGEPATPSVRMHERPILAHLLLAHRWSPGEVTTRSTRWRREGPPPYRRRIVLCAAAAQLRSGAYRWSSAGAQSTKITGGAGRAIRAPCVWPCALGFTGGPRKVNLEVNSKLVECRRSDRVL